MGAIQVMPDNPMSVITLFDADKKGLDYFIEYIANTIESGNDDPLKVLTISKKMEYVTKRVTERIKEAAEREAAKYGEKFAFMGTEVHYTATHTEYDYSVCNHPEWAELKKSLDNLQNFLKALKEPIDIRVGDELVTVHPPFKKQTMGLKTTVK